ncbi:MAG: exodeoxyribonuclease V subunit gamma [Halospina sp.]
MIHTFPGNQLEHLVGPLARLLAVPVTNPLQPDVIMVQHPGMAHWLNMELAGEPSRRVAMNLEYPLPVRYFWTLIRGILGPERMPEVSPYQREILVWRLYSLLASEGVARDPAFAEPTRYWQQQSARQQPLRRFQLAGELADLYEQYLMYRPDWIREWDAGQGDHWQARLWQALVAEIPDHPLRLMDEARGKLATPAEALPERLFIFGINSLAPLWLEFISEVSRKAGVDFHILYLNPSDEYWGDAVSDRQAARQRARWLDEHDDESGLVLDVGNPLLTGLGHQGQQFVRLLSEVADEEMPLFTEPADDQLLARLQSDVLHLRDGREAPSDHCDSSIDVVSAHSALREVQALHDWLLHRFNEDPELAPRDVVVMCPNVERYAPFVEAVFAGRGEALSERVPPLPSSIADRNPGDADPAVAAFVEMLSLPDARFEVSRVISWLQVPAIQQRFGFDTDQVTQLSQWLNAAAIHWGLDAEHKRQWLGEGASQRYSWDQGLERLLIGFAWGDEEVVLRDRLLLPQVEGGDAVVLGRLIAFLRALKALRQDMTRARTVSDWQTFLHERLRQALFSTERSHEWIHEQLREVIRELGQYAIHAGFNDPVPLTVIRHALEQNLQSPARTGGQFMTGQITVCSMVPMRSIPFRVVAILGLNDGEFPRQRPPLGFDLMANDRPRPGDRSRRGDDRYLFLEAILSAREHLYLSYQGRDLNTNAERQPSLVLTELMNYLEAATGWHRDAIRALPLQPFSPANYQGPEPSFDPGWLRLSEAGEKREQAPRLPPPESEPERLSLEQLVRALENPARHHAQQRLGLYLEESELPELEDVEPFAANHLSRYLIQEALIHCELEGADEAPVLERARLSGELPDHAPMASELADWREQARGFAQALLDSGAAGVQTSAVEHSIDGLTLAGELTLAADGRLVLWRMANPKGKDLLRLWCHHLIANLDGERSSVSIHRGRDGALRVMQFESMVPGEAETQLTALVKAWRESLCEPSRLHGDLLRDLAGMDADADEAKRLRALRNAWLGDSFNGFPGVRDDAYIGWFFEEDTDTDSLLAAIDSQYGRLMAALTITDTTEAV